MSVSTRVIFRRALPVAALVALAVAAAIVIDSLRGGASDTADPDPAPDGRSANRTHQPTLIPAAFEGLPDDRIQALSSAREAIRAAGGASPESVETLGRVALTLAKDRRPPVLMELRSDFRLALHSRNTEAALRTLAILHTAASSPQARSTLSEPAFRTVLQAALSHADASVRCRSVELLPLLDTPLARANAIEALSDSDGSVRAAAARAYSAFTERPSLPRLCAMFAEDEDPRVRLALLQVFGSSGRELRRPAVFAAEQDAFQDGVPAEKIQVLENLALWRDHELLPDLLAALRSPDVPLQRAVLRTLLTLRNKGCRDEVESLSARTDNPAIKELAAKVLDAIGE